MTTNRILEKRPEKVGKLGMDRLVAYRDWLNEQPWVRETGGLYFIGRKEKADGTVEYRLDRNG